MTILRDPGLLSVQVAIATCKYIASGVSVSTSIDIGTDKNLARKLSARRAWLTVVTIPAGVSRRRGHAEIAAGASPPPLMNSLDQLLALA